MIIRALDDNNDWTYGKGKSDYLTEQEALIQDLETRLKEWKFNCFFDLEKGVDYKSYLARGTKNFLDSDIKRVTLQTDGVIRINTFESDLGEDDRELTVTMNIYTVYGNLDFSFLGGREEEL